MKKFVLILSAALFLTAGVLQAKVELPSVLSDNMVLQRESSVALWGKAEPGKTVSVTVGWSKEKVMAKADSQTGKWLVRVATPSAGGPYDITFSDGEKTTLRNVLIGEVWFCSGQSNMDMPVKGYAGQPAKNGMDYIVGAKPSRPIRVCHIKQNSSRTVVEESQGCWKEHTPDVVASTSAAAYFFADALQSVLDVPVGLLISCWGGSSIETWIPREVISSEFPEFNLAFLDDPSIKVHNYHSPCLLYNGQVAPLVPFTFKGMIWYQGETNRGRPDQYVRLQTAYARTMRELFQVPEAPFYFVQIAPCPYDNPDGWRSGYFYEAQQKTLETIPHSGMAATVDVGEFGTVHASDKQTVGRRLAYLAMKHDYGFDSIEADAPTFKSVEFRDGKSFVSCNVGFLGLSPMGVDIDGFEVAGEDKVFHPAIARINQKDFSLIEIVCPEVAEPVAVRYCFRNWGVGKVFNNYGIPLVPFRTDNWGIREVR